MRTKKLGRTGLDVSIVGLGGANLGLPHPHLIKDADVGGLDIRISQDMDTRLGVAAVHAALENGVTLIDTAPRYGLGMSERIIRDALGERPDLAATCRVTTKIGFVRPYDGFDYSYEAAMHRFEGSQMRLGIDHFPVVYLHDPMGLPMKFVMSRSGVMGALRELQKQKVIDYVGIAANNPETAADYIETGEFDVATVSGAWSLINQMAATRILPAAEAHNVGIVVTTAIERGLLATGDPIPGVRYLERNFSLDILAHIQKINSLCMSFGVSLLDVALQWVTRHPQVATTIPGARIPEEARMNAIAGDSQIPDALWEELQPLIRHFDYRI